MFGDLTLDQILLILLVGGACFLGFFVMFIGIYLFTETKETPVRDRLMLIKAMGQGDASSVDKVGEMKEAFLDLVSPIAQNLYGKNVTFLQSIKNTLTEAGMSDNDDAIRRFLSVRVACSFVVGGIMAVLTLIIFKNLIFAMGGLILGLLVGGMFPQMRLKGIATKRKAEIRFTLSDTLDLMVVCMEAGLGLDSTFQRIAEESERIAPDLSLEFKRLTKELNAGITRTEAFHNLGVRAGVDELKALCALIIQTDKLGTSIADTLRIYAEDVRTKRRQRAELLASQASIKMTFPLVLLIFPPMFIVLIGPAVIQTLSIFLNK